MDVGGDVGGHERLAQQPRAEVRNDEGDVREGQGQPRQREGIAQPQIEPARKADPAPAHEAAVATLFALSAESVSPAAPKPERPASAWRSAARAKMVRPR